LLELSKRHPEKAVYLQELANAYNWMGESERAGGTDRTAAVRAYNSAIEMQEKLAERDPANRGYQQELARSHYNRGLARFADRHNAEAESDYRIAIELLEPVQDARERRQELARTYNDLAILLKTNKKPAEARQFYEKAIAIHDALTMQYPESRDYDLELAKFNQNFGILLQSQNDLAAAEQHNQRAIELYEKLANPVPALGISLAYAHTLRGLIRESQGNRDGAVKEYQLANDQFDRLDIHTKAAVSPEFHLRYGDSLFHLANLSLDNPSLATNLLEQAITHHAKAGFLATEQLCYDYYVLANEFIKVGAFAEATNTLSKLAAKIGDLPDTSQASYRTTVESLNNEISRRTLQKQSNVRRSGVRKYEAGVYRWVIRFFRFIGRAAKSARNAEPGKILAGNRRAPIAGPYRERYWVSGKSIRWYPGEDPV
jgi:tetratricopeptide (TPR) repeat protein